MGFLALMVDTGRINAKDPAEGKRGLSLCDDEILFGVAGEEIMKGLDHIFL